MTFDIILIGFGHVGRRFVRLLDERRTILRRDHDVETRIVSVATRSRGCVYDPRGLTEGAGGWGLGTGKAESVFFQPPDPSPQGPLKFLRQTLRKCASAARAGRLVVVEVTTLDIESGQPAIDHVRAALAGGAHVVTANKGPAAFAYRSLEAAAARARRAFRFESAVLDGIPIFNLARAALPAVDITGFRGVVNSTTNHILTAMEDGQPFDAALAAMQQAGIAEADASLDVDGWDAAAKTAILSNVLLGGDLTPHTVDREGITSAAGERVRAARARQRRVKLVASGERAGRRVAARVRLEELADTDLLATLDGQQNAVVLSTDLLGEIAIVERGSGLTQTAYGLVSDLVAIAREAGVIRRTRRARPRAIRQARPPARPGRTPSRRDRRRS